MKHRVFTHSHPLRQAGQSADAYTKLSITHTANLPLKRVDHNAIYIVPKSNQHINRHASVPSNLTSQAADVNTRANINPPTCQKRGPNTLCIVTRMIRLLISCLWKSLKHRYLRKVDCSSFVMCPLLVLPLRRAFFAVATYSTNQTNKAGSMCH
jgi:hypothetical protein